MAMAMAIRARLDDRIGFNFNDLMMTESMLPEEQETMLRYNPGGIVTTAAGIPFRRL
jgi:hypothetical protein